MLEKETHQQDQANKHYHNIKTNKQTKKKHFRTFTDELKPAPFPYLQMKRSNPIKIRVYCYKAYKTII